MQIIDGQGIDADNRWAGDRWVDAGNRYLDVGETYLIIVVLRLWLNMS